MVICLHDMISVTYAARMENPGLVFSIRHALIRAVGGKGFLIDLLLLLSGRPQFVKQTSKKKTIFKKVSKRRPQRSECLL